jgi:hypothetical protein
VVREDLRDEESFEDNVELDDFQGEIFNDIQE